MCEFTAETQTKMSEHEKDFHNIKNYSCGKCDKIFKFSEELKQHVEREHEQSNRSPGTYSRKEYSLDERRRNGFCRFWNHSSCSFGNQCKFVHEEAPFCRFQGQCRAMPKCKYYHEEMDKKKHFLGYGRNQASWRRAQGSH